MARTNAIARPLQRAVLVYLADVAQGYRLVDAPFVALPEGTHSRTITALIIKDFIVTSTLMGIPEYKITSRGLKALQKIEAIKSRRALYGQATCHTPGCANPIYITPGGQRKARCKECFRAIGREKYAKRGVLLDPKKPCPRCGGNRHITKSGTVRPYCLPCLRRSNRVYGAQYEARIEQRIAQGEEVLCLHCGDTPVTRLRGGKPSYLCRSCLSRKQRLWDRSYRQRRQRRKIEAFLKRSE